MGKRNYQCGFTLGETLATLAVVGISLAVAVPSLRTLTSNNRRATSVNQLVTTMHVARSEAVMRNQRVTVCPSIEGKSCEDSTWQQGWIAFLDSNVDGQRDSSETIIDQVAGLPGLQLTSAEFPRSFSYRSDGRAQGATPEENTGEFAFCEPGAKTAARVLILRANGLPVLSDRRGDGEPATCPSA